MVTNLQQVFYICIVVLAGLAMGLFTWHDGMSISWQALADVSWTLSLWLCGCLLLWYRGKADLQFHPLYVAVCILGLYLFLRVANAPDFYYLHWFSSKPSELAESWSERVFLIGGAMMILASINKKYLMVSFFIILVLLQISSFYALMQVTGGEPLYRVDHPSFFHRLSSFAEVMPRFVYFDPFWNGGEIKPYLVASAVTAPGLFLWPVWRFIPMELAYTPAFGFLFIFVVPALAVWAVSLLTRNKITWICAACIALGTSHFYFVHLVHYGTFGALFAAAFLMPFSAALYRIIVVHKTDKKTWISLVVSGFFLLCWPGIVGLFLPFAVTFLVNFHRLTRRIVTGLLLCAAVLGCLHILPAMSVLSYSNIDGMVQTTGSVFTADAFYHGIDVLKELLRPSHPVLLILGMLGVLLLPGKMKYWFFPFILTSMIFAAWGKEWKALMQFDRVWLDSLFVMVLPASMAYGYLYRRKDLFAFIATAFITGLIIMGGYASVKYMGNEGRADFRTMSPEMKEISRWIQENVPEDGRVLFAGPTSHSYGAAKIAALPALTGREMMACDYYGFSPKLVEYGYPPKRFREGGQRTLMQFFDMYNVTHIITVHANWKRFLRRYDTYEEKRSWRTKTIFAVKRPSDMFYRGTGKVKSAMNLLDVTLQESNAPSVIKYNWVDELSCEPEQVELSPFDAGQGIQFIQIDPHGASAVKISYKRWY